MSLSVYPEQNMLPGMLAWHAAPFWKDLDMPKQHVAKFWGSKMTIFTFPKPLIYQFRETTVTWRVSQAEKELND